MSNTPLAVVLVNEKETGYGVSPVILSAVGTEVQICAGDGAG